MKHPARSHRARSRVPFIAWLALIGILAILAGLASGCATGYTLKRTLFRPVLQTNVQPDRIEAETTYETNVVAMPAITNLVTGEIITPTTLVIRPRTNIVFRPGQTVVTTQRWEKRPETEAVIGAVGVAVPGWGTLISGALGGITSIWLALLNRRTRQEAQTQGETAAALVRGVEQFRDGLRSTPATTVLDERLKAILQKEQIAAGARVFENVLQLLDQHTESRSADAPVSPTAAAPAPAVAPTPAPGVDAA